MFGSWKGLNLESSFPFPPLDEVFICFGESWPENGRGPGALAIDRSVLTYRLLGFGDVTERVTRLGLHMEASGHDKVSKEKSSLSAVLEPVVHLVSSWFFRNFFKLGLLEQFLRDFVGVLVGNP